MVLALAALLALAAEVLSGGLASPARTRSTDALGDIGEFLRENSSAAENARPDVTLRLDPFGAPQPETRPNSVAPRRNASTVVSEGAGSTRRLTAILVANDRPVAVIDNEVVGLGDSLRGGARVSRIQSDRVFLIEKDGKWRTLTLAPGRP
jgi:hypothetical protein